ncbi:MAG: UbiA family prenyltransferase [Halanaeroarchaeum sp.]
MAIARREGPGGALAALASQVHPVFMLPPVAVSLFGSVLAGRFAVDLALLHAGAIFFAVYTAHVKDGYVDFYVRDEDDDHPMTARGCRLALAGATVAVAAVTGVLWAVVDVAAALLTVPGWVLGYLHAPHLDTNPVTATASYPLGIALALLGGFYVQSGTLTVTAVAVSVVLLVTLSGVKVVDDAQDVAFDRSIEKRTVAVVLGERRGRRVGYGLLGAGLVGVVGLAIVGWLPTGSVLAVFAFGAVALVASTKDATVATMLLVRGAYLFLAFLVLAVWFRPLTPPLPFDVSVLGPYTYIVTEAVFATVALGLLVRADALVRGAVTVAAVYPLGYLWDWYSLQAGVFAIPYRTGIEVLGIPLEEHLFILIVPALVVGVHELLRASDVPA